MSEWQPIETFQVHPFVQEDWHVPGKPVLLWIGYAAVGRFGYTQKGKGRWQVYGQNADPTHWMPLPEKPQ